MTDESNNVLGPHGLPKPTAEYEQAEMDKWLARVKGTDLPHDPLMNHDPYCPVVGIDEYTRRDLLIYCQCDMIAKVRADLHALANLLAKTEALMAVDEYKADLRDKVEALPSERVNGRDCYWADDIFALIDGGGDDKG